jgi:hypothetical protein
LEDPHKAFLTLISIKLPNIWNRRQDLDSARILRLQASFVRVGFGEGGFANRVRFAHRQQEYGMIVA